MIFLPLATWIKMFCSFHCDQSNLACNFPIEWLNSWIQVQISCLYFSYLLLLSFPKVQRVQVVAYTSFFHRSWVPKMRLSISCCSASGLSSVTEWQSYPMKVSASPSATTIKLFANLVRLNHLSQSHYKRGLAAHLAAPFYCSIPLSQIGFRSGVQLLLSLSFYEWLLASPTQDFSRSE